MAKRKGNPAKAGWDPMVEYEPNPNDGMTKAFLETDGRKHWYTYRTPMRAVGVQAFANRLYNGTLLWFEDGSGHFSFKRNDRAAVRDWRHVQAIKNEIAGPEREAIEIYPPESALVDAANEYHLWILPPDLVSPLGFEARAVATEEDARAAGMRAFDSRNRRAGLPPGGRQRPWEPGLPTGPAAKDAA